MASLDYDRGRGSSRDFALCLVAALVVAVIVALLAVSTADANDRNWFHTDESRAAGLENRINTFRINHNLGTLFPASNLYAAAYTINWANYRQGQVTDKIFGAPFGVWMSAYQTDANKLFTALLRRGRCHHWPGTPYQVMRRWKRIKLARRALKNPLATSVGVHVSLFKRHRGDFKNKGRCIIYSAVIAS